MKASGAGFSIPERGNVVASCWWFSIGCENVRMTSRRKSDQILQKQAFCFRVVCVCACVCGGGVVEIVVLAACIYIYTFVFWYLYIYIYTFIAKPLKVLPLAEDSISDGVISDHRRRAFG